MPLSAEESDGSEYCARLATNGHVVAPYTVVPFPLESPTSQGDPGDALSSEVAASILLYDKLRGNGGPSLLSKVNRMNPSRLTPGLEKLEEH